MELTNFSRVAIIGGGPAGSLTAYFMLDIAKQLGIHLNLDIYEPALYSAPGPKGCNFCGGIVSETLVQMLAMEGINLPPDVVQRGIDSYFLHTEQGSASIQTPLDEMRIAALYRGAGPLDCIKRSAEISFQDKVVYKSFDGFLQQLAIQSGANVITKRVAEVIREEPFPVVVPKGGEPRRYDLVVGAVGVNGGGIKLFEKTMPNFKAPQTTTAFLTEIFMDREKVDKYFGNAMHVFLVKIPHVNFAAIVPKAEYVSVILLGKGVNKESAKAFLSHPDVKKCFP
jgi:flavin-dependent dehydrogenase